MITAFGWILTAGGLIGAILNARKNILSYYIWTATNIGLVVLHTYQRQYYTAFMFAGYTIIALYGTWNWRKHGKSD